MPKYKIEVRYLAEGNKAGSITPGDIIVVKEIEAENIEDANAQGKEIADKAETIRFKAYQHSVAEIE